MRTFRRFCTSAAAVVTSALLVAGCAAAPERNIPAEPGSTPDGQFELAAAWLDEGRLAGVVTWGSSTCVPVADEVTADGQTVNVTLDEGDPQQPCTADLVPRTSLVGLPAGVVATQDLQLIVTLGSATADTNLAGNASLTGVPGEPTDYAPSAGWFDDGQLVLLTWGSSSCPPIVESVEATENAGTITFTTEDRPCTRDLAPRTTIIDFGELGADIDMEGFLLTLVGDDLDATLSVAQG